jgi:Lrp/AsnC family transcriptional regulator, leucine-responsive regulatory protein
MPRISEPFSGYRSPGECSGRQGTGRKAPEAPFVACVLDKLRLDVLMGDDYSYFYCIGQTMTSEIRRGTVDPSAESLRAPTLRQTLDETDRQIVILLQGDARMSNAEVARRLDMAPSAIFDRIRKLEERGIIAGYEAHVNAKALGLGLTAFIFVRGEDGPSDPGMGALLAKIPEVQEVHHVAGEDCYLVKVRVADTDALGMLLRERIGAVKAVRSTRTTIVLGTLKETHRLPIPTDSARDGKAARR